MGGGRGRRGGVDGAKVSVPFKKLCGSGRERRDYEVRMIDRAKIPFHSKTYAGREKRLGKGWGWGGWGCGGWGLGDGGGGGVGGGGWGDRARFLFH